MAVFKNTCLFYSLLIDTMKYDVIAINEKRYRTLDR